MKLYEDVYYSLSQQAQLQTKDFRENNVSAWCVLRSMIRRQPNYLGLGLWQFIECAMVGWRLKELAHRDMPNERRKNKVL